MELTYFIAQLFGIYLLIVGLVMVFRKHMFLEVINGFYDSPATLFLAGWMAMLVGLFMVLIHNYWNNGVLALVITLAGWAAFLKGARTPLHAENDRSWMHVARLEKFFYLYATIVFIVGLYLTHAGFTHAGLFIKIASGLMRLARE